MHTAKIRQERKKQEKEKLRKNYAGA